MAQVLDSEITIDKLDYPYIKKCSNGKELEKILRVLRSGKEGIYPDLIKFCEERLESVNPESRALRVQRGAMRSSDLKHDELNELNESLKEWQDKMSEADRVNGHGDSSDLPPVRSAHTLKGKKKTQVHDASIKKTNPSKITGYDYRSWDKYDVDGECAKVDEQQENSGSGPGQRKITVSEEVSTKGLSQLDKEVKAVNEKNKGNEAFKSGDIEEALAYYSRSILLMPTPASYNNRALAYLKLERWKEAKSDCDIVLSSPGEEGNIKAKLRRATACKSLARFKEAKKDLEFVLQKEPNNARAKSILNEVENQLSKETESKKHPDSPPAKPGKTMVIQEVDGDSDEEEENEELPGGESSDCNEGARSPPAQEKVGPAPPPVESTTQESQKLATGTTEQPQSVAPKFPPKTEAFKSRATDFFKSGRYGEASEQYSKAIDSLAAFIKTHPKEEAYDVALAVLHNNRAACWLKEGNDRACIDDCTRALELKPWDAKALMRRAVAYEHMERYARSYADFKSAESIDWNNNFAQDGASRAASHLRQIHGHKWRDHLPTVPMYSHRNNTEVPASQTLDSRMQESTAVSTPKEKDINGNLKAGKTHPRAEKANAQKHAQPKKASPDSRSKTIKIEEFTSKPKPKMTKQEKTQAKMKTAKNAKLSKQGKKLAKQKEELEKEAKRDEIKRKLFDDLKTKGNNHVKTGDYASAVDCYTRCITLCPKETASYTNRALCFLKLKKNVSAANDCTEAIKLDPVNVKAYYRRSQARKAEGMLKDAERDLMKLLGIDPGNKAATAELKAIKENQKGDKTVKDVERDTATDSGNVQRPRVQKPSAKKMIIEEVDDSGSDEEFVIPEEEKVDPATSKPGVETGDQLEKASKPEQDSESVASEDPTVKKSPQTPENGIQLHNARDDSEDPELPSVIEETSDVLSASSTDTPQKEDACSSKPVEESSINKTKDPGPPKKPLTPPSAPEEKISDVLTASSTDTPQKEDASSNKSVEESSTNKTKDPGPPKKPLTPYEFGVVWNSIANKSNIDAYKKILKDVVPTDLPALISNKIDDHFISVIAKVALESVGAGDPQRAYELMSNLSKADRFSMAAMFLSDKDAATVRSTFDALSSQELQCSDLELRILKKAYCV